MRWQDLRQSTNVEDRRGMSGRGIALGGGSLGFVILAAVIWLCSGGDPSQLLDSLQQQTQVQPQQQQTASNSSAPAPDENGRFARAIMASTEDVWSQILPQQARIRYTAPVLVLYTDQTTSACGYSSAATGPFYCPGDQKLYLDFGFFRELERDFKAKGDFARAYVIAHEVGHHVQNLLGTMDKVQRAGNSNRLSVALELQADCYAGVWANYAQKQGLLEPGDADEALNAASSVGDDMIQKRTQGYVVPESFTHGSAEQRMQYFATGMRSGDMRQCQTIR
ncbi:MAG TPA: neutral zinc metallopeptidase [Pyrinomonadaceae bacterium]|nr:neutral zinc metallopeptidase [Pyrinomonadaceae bacterium]